MEKETKDFDLYESGIKFNMSLKPEYYKTNKINTEFYEGNQWIGSQDTTLPKPTFNILKRVGSYFVAQLTSTPIRVNMTPLLYSNVKRGINPELDDKLDKVEIAQSTVKKIYERNSFDSLIIDSVERAIKTGDMVAHIKFNPDIKPYVYNPSKKYKGDVEIEILDGANVFFGNANIRDVEKQPYIIISGRDTIENLKRECDNAEEKEKIVSDRDTDYEMGNVEEVEALSKEDGKALYIIKYYKKDGKVYMNKSTKTAIIKENIPLEIERYPIAFNNYERQSGCYHGRALITGLIPNQVFINRMWAMVMYHLTLNAFPKVVYDASKISSWTNEIGTSVPVDNTIGEQININNVAKYLEPAQMSPQVSQMLSEVMSSTKDMLGINDAILGNINPTNTSAILAVQKSGAVPLKNIQKNLYKFVEDMTLITLDMTSARYGKRDIVVDIEKENQITEFDFAELKDLPMSLDIEISEGGYYDELAQLSTLDNLLQLQQITIIDYLERMPDKVIPKRIELLNKKNDELQQQAEMQNEEVEAEQVIEYVKTLPKEFQQYLSTLNQDEALNIAKELMNLPPDEQNQIIGQMIQQIA